MVIASAILIIVISSVVLISFHKRWAICLSGKYMHMYVCFAFRWIICTRNLRYFKLLAIKVHWKAEVTIIEIFLRMTRCRNISWMENKKVEYLVLHPADIPTTLTRILRHSLNLLPPVINNSCFHCLMISYSILWSLTTLYDSCVTGFILTWSK